MKARDAARQPTTPRTPCHKDSPRPVSTVLRVRKSRAIQGVHDWDVSVPRSLWMEGRLGQETTGREARWVHQMPAWPCVQSGSVEGWPRQPPGTHSPLTRIGWSWKNTAWFSRKAFLLQSKLPSGRVEGKSKGIQNICQQFQAGKTHRNKSYKKKQKLKEY